MAIRVKVRMTRLAGVGFHQPKSAAQPSLSLRCSPHCPATHELGAASYLPRRIPLGVWIAAINGGFFAALNIAPGAHKWNAVRDGDYQLCVLCVAVAILDIAPRTQRL
jgi:hypothetical protein